MRILFAIAHPYLPQLTGGTQINTHHLVEALIQRGHAVAVCSGLLPVGFRARLDQVLIKSRLDRTPCNRLMGYPLYRTWFPQDELARTAARFRPDVIVVQSGNHVPIWEEAKALRIPVAVYLHNVDFSAHAGQVVADDDTLYIANSEYTARAYRDAFGVECRILRPYFEEGRFRVEATGSKVTFFNPHPDKGVEVAMGVAALCRGLEFLFIKTWELEPSYEFTLRNRLRDLPNVKLFGPVVDTRAIFARTRLLLVPSQVDETWGRVVTEAQFSGIPAVASDRGGLPESVGPGGILMPKEADARAWAGAIQGLLRDEERFQNLSAAALGLSRRPELDPSIQVATLEQMLADLVGRPRR